MKYLFLIFIFTLFIYINNKSLIIGNTRTQICIKKRILVTGSSSNHFHLLLLMLYTVYKYEKDICFVVWDLGLLKVQKKKFYSLYGILKRNRKDIILINNIFNYSSYPSFFNIRINAGQYAWKPIIISTTYYTYKKPLLWLDAGCNIIGSLQKIYNEIVKYKVWSIGAGRDVKRYTHLKTLEYLNASKSIWSNIMCAGGVVGLYYPDLLIDQLLKKYVSCSLEKECISPNNSNRNNHRQDQSVFTILLYQFNFSCYRGSNKYNFSTHFDRYYSFYNDTYYSNTLKKLN